MPTLKLNKGEIILRIVDKKMDSILVSAQVAAHRQGEDTVADLIEGQVYEIKRWEGQQLMVRHLRATEKGVEELSVEEFDKLTID